MIDEAQLVERDGLLGQRVRADDEVDRAARELREHLAPLRRRERAGQRRDAKPRRVEQPANRQVVLVGQDLGRRHERDLQAVLHRDERREQRDDRLAGADVALQQPVHRLGALHVGDDFAQRRLLAVGQLERQHLPRRLADAIVDDHGAALAIGRVPPLAQDQPGLKQEELLEDQPPLRRRAKAVQRVDVGARRREMRVGDRLPAIRQAPGRANRRRQRIGELRGQLASSRCTSVRCMRGVIEPAFS